MRFTTVFLHGAPAARFDRIGNSHDPEPRIGAEVSAVDIPPASSLSNDSHADRHFHSTISCYRAKSDYE
jgi:hypothetical protein